MMSEAKTEIIFERVRRIEEKIDLIERHLKKIGGEKSGIV